MAKINVLDSSIYNKISAGEVVEKPASVVKELVENSIDSGATEIIVSIKEGGISFIEVSDNGSGIEKEQFEKVFLPHATSKIAEASDLDAISTLGFRGEAMASIASVSMVKLESAVENGDAYSVECNGGMLGEIMPASRAKGTTVTVRNLFYNTPARLKFLKKGKSEEREIVSIMEKLAFANYFIKIELYADGKPVFKTRGEGLLQCIEAIYGKDISENLLEINVEQYGMKMTGYISDVSFSKPTRSYQTFIVNGRVVVNVSLVTALNKVYEDFFVKRSYPFGILELTLNADEIDVNVHPAKTEIRFEYQNKVYSFLQRNLKKRLEDSLYEQRIVFAKRDGVVDEEWLTPFQSSDEKQPEKEAEPIKENAFDTSEYEKEKSYQKSKMEAFNAFAFGSDFSIKLDTNSNPKREELSGGYEAPVFADSCSDMLQSPSYVDYSSKTTYQPQRIQFEERIVENYDYRIVGQLFGTYILLEFEDYLMVIDQHAAAEYTLYEKLKKQIDEKRIEIQPLMLPITLNLDTDNISVFEDNLYSLRSIGVEIDKISEYEYSVTAIPLLLAELDFNKLIGYLFTDEDPELGLRERLMVKACRSAIKGNTYLDNQSIEIFLKSLFKDGMHPKCPHGRPSYIKLTKKDFEKMFLRIV